MRAYGTGRSHARSPAFATGLELVYRSFEYYKLPPGTGSQRDLTESVGGLIPPIMKNGLLLLPRKTLTSC